MVDYKSNSYKSKEEKKADVPEKKVEKVISGTARTKKKSEFSKFANTFISEDIQSVKDYILMDVLVPAVKKAISDVVTNGIDMILYGESGSKGSSSTASKISYRSYYDRPNDRERHRSSGFDYDDVLLDSRGEAESILDRMDELISTYHVVSVADFYELADITNENYMNNKYGWKDIRSAKIVRTRDGYMIRMPRALPID